MPVTLCCICFGRSSVSQSPELPARAYPSHTLLPLAEGVGSESLLLAAAAASSTAALPNAPKAAGQLKAFCSEFDQALLLGVAA